MENPILTKWEKKFLYALKKYQYVEIGERELHGYFAFPPIETTLSAIGGVTSKGLVKKKEHPSHGYELTEAGDQYLKQHRMSLVLQRHITDIAIGVIAGGIVAAGPALLGFIQKAIG